MPNNIIIDTTNVDGFGLQISSTFSFDCTMQQKNKNDSKYQRSLTKTLFGQLTKLNNFIINQETNEAKLEENVLEFDKNDQLISKSESECRIIAILGVVALINQFILSALTILLIDNLKHELKMLPFELPVQFKIPYLQVILNNGSVLLSHFKEDTFFNYQHQFDLPTFANYYYSFDYRGKMSYIHGKSKRNYFYQTFKNVQRKKREKKHLFPGIHAYDTDARTGFNCSIVQVGSKLVLFGGGIDRSYYGMLIVFFRKIYV